MERRLLLQVPLFYDLHVPQVNDQAPVSSPRTGWPLVIALHGYGQSKESMMRRALPIDDSSWALASVQGPHGFVLPDRPADRRTGYNWGARTRHPEAVRVHHRAVLSVLDAVDQEIGIDRTKVFLLGFSQPVSFNYRFVFTYPGLIRGVIGICGGIPGDSETAPYSPSSTEVLHLAGASDEFYPEAKVRGFRPWLERLSPSPTLEFFAGGHVFPTEHRETIGSWIRTRLETSSSTAKSQRSREA